MDHFEWRINATTALAELRGGAYYTGFEIRRHITDRIGPPHHPNCWGALIRQAVKAGWLIDTGNTTNDVDSPSHGSRTPIWMKKGGVSTRDGGIGLQG